MIAEGFVLLIAGMSVVFAFLAVMVLIMKIMSFIILKYFPENKETVSNITPVMKPEPIVDDTEIAVAIAAAYIGVLS